MQDVLGQISARTGGLASSYAATAAQQRQNDYMAKLEEAARQMYEGERSERMDNASLLRTLSSDEYDRYLNRLDQWNQDRSFAYSAARDALSDSRYDDETAYDRLRDALSDSRYDDETAYSRDRDALADLRYDREYTDSRADTAWNQRMTERQYADSRADELYSRALAQSAPKLDLSEALSMYGYGVRSTEVMDALRDYLGDDADTAALEAAAAANIADTETEKPSLTWEQMNEVLPDEQLRNTEGVQKSYDAYYGDGSYAEHYGEPEDDKIQGFKAHAAVFLRKQGNEYAHAYLSRLVAENQLSWEAADAIAKELGITEIDER